MTGTGPTDPEAEPLRRILAERGLKPRHARDLLDAFRMDARKSRYRDWGELMHYCSLSAMPVGRFVLDVHGEAETTWAASDPLCAALQVINHLQDCARDYRDLDRVYLPQDALAEHRADVADLAGARATPALLSAIRDVNARSAGLLRQSASFPSRVHDRRLGLEVAVIQNLAEALVAKLGRLDPLADRVHAGKAEAALHAVSGILRGLWQRRPGGFGVGAPR